MKSRLALLPDLLQCFLEDRILPAAYVLVPLPFLPYNSLNNSFVVAGSGGTGGSSGGSTLYPGEPSFYLRLGINLGSAGNGSGNGSGGSGFSTGATQSVTGYAASFVGGVTAASFVSGGGGGGSSSTSGGSGGTGDTTSGGGNAGGLGNFGGYGANISSGYSFALNSANNFGMSATTLGSVPVHTYGGGGDPTENQTPENGNPPAGANPNGNEPAPNPMNGNEQRPNPKLYEHLIRNPGQLGSKPATTAPADAAAP